MLDEGRLVRNPEAVPDIMDLASVNEILKRRNEIIPGQFVLRILSA